MLGIESNLSCIPSSSISPLNLKRNPSDTNKLRSRFSQDAVFYLQQASGTFQFSFFLRRCSTCFKSNVIFTICFILDQSPCLEQHGCVIEVKKNLFSWIPCLPCHMSFHSHFHPSIQELECWTNLLPDFPALVFCHTTALEGGLQGF